MKATKAGFTMVEMLVVTLLGSFLLLGVMQIFLGILRGGERANNLAELRQAGDYALLSIERRLREADDIDCVSDYVLDYYVIGSSTAVQIRQNALVGVQAVYVGSDAVTGEDVDVVPNGLQFLNCDDREALGEYDSVDISLTLQPAEGVGNPETLRTSITLRNNRF